MATPVVNAVGSQTLFGYQMGAGPNVFDTSQQPNRLQVFQSGPPLIRATISQSACPLTPPIVENAVLPEKTGELICPYRCQNGYGPNLRESDFRATCDVGRGVWVVPPVLECQRIDEYACSEGIENYNANEFKPLNKIAYIFTNSTFSSCGGEGGYIAQWDFQPVKYSGPLFVGVWRPLNGNRLKLVGFNEIPITSLKKQSYHVPVEQRILVRSGDLMGIHFADNMKTEPAPIAMLPRSDSVFFGIETTHSQIISDGGIITLPCSSVGFGVPALFARVLSNLLSEFYVFVKFRYLNRAKVFAE